MKRNYIFALVIIFMLMVVSTTFCMDVYVKAGASGRGTSKTDPYGELWKAVDKAKRGDVIHVAAGTYNGKGGSGHFKIGIPNLTLVGGYNADFSKRDPFKYFTILERAKDYKGDWTGLPEGIIAGDIHADHSNLIVDGFVLNAQSRNRYSDGGDKVALKAPSYPGLLFQTSSKNTKIRNSILMNPVGNGIYCTWQGEENEVSNCFILNTLYAALSTRSAQPDSIIRIKNNTIAFVWFHPAKGGGIGVFVGRQGQTIMENNILSFLQTEGGSDGFAVKNTFGNEDTIMKNNVFFSCTGGYYKYMDFNKASLVLWKPDELEDFNDEDYCEDFMLYESGGNREEDPGLNPDKEYAIKFANFIESTPGKLNMDAMNEWRRSVGLPLQAEKGSARPVLAPAYPLDKVVPNLAGKIKGAGVQVDGPFQEYRAEAVAELPESYEEVDFKSMKKGEPYSKGMTGKAVTFQACMGAKKTVYEISDIAPRSDYTCVELLISSSKGSMTMDKIYGYLLNGSEAHADWEKLYRKKDNYNSKGGVFIKGQVYSFKNQNYSYPVGIIIQDVSRKK